MKIVTFNIRFSWDHDGLNSFVNRAGMILGKITEERPDIICFQEATDKNMNFLKEYLSKDYTFIFSQRCEGFTQEGVATAFLNKTISLHGLREFWLSETPYEVASRFEGQSPNPRVCQSLIFKDETNGRIFRVFNTHLEDISEEVRAKHIKVMFEELKQDIARMPLPFLMLGDMNAEPQGEAMKFFYDNMPIKLRDLADGITETYHNYGRQLPGWKIDYIFADEYFSSLPHIVECWNNKFEGIYLSDHYPIAVTID